MIKGKDLVNPLRHLSDATMVPGLSLQFDIAGPWLVKTKSKQATLLTRQEKKEKRSTTKMWILLAVDYFTSKLEVSPLEDMTTGSISSAIQDIIIANGWATRRLSIDPGSSLVTAMRDTSEAVADLKDEEDYHEEAVDIHQAKELINGLEKEGFTIKIPFAKASFHQSKIESTIKSFKVCFKATQLPGASPLSIVTFITVIRRCVALLNSRPIAIIPQSLADPDEILSVSPSSLTGPASSSWWSLGKSRDYAGQQALIQAHLTRFKSKWKTFYTNRLYSNSNMATRSDLQKDDIVLITDLSNNSTRGIHPALGRITGFLDPDSQSQAIVKYSNGKVDRPISKLVVVVRADEQIPAKGKCFCPTVQTDDMLQEDEEIQEEILPDQNELEEASSLPDGDHPDPQVHPPRLEGLLPQTMETTPPRQVVVEDQEKKDEDKDVLGTTPPTVVEEDKEEKDEDKDVLTVRHNPDTQAEQVALSSRPQRQRRPLNKF